MTKLLRIFFLFASCFAFPLSNAQAETKKIGVVFGLTGDAAKWSAYMRMGMELAAEEINYDLGKDSLKLIWQDSGSSAAKSIAAFRELTELEKVDAVIGEVFTYLTEPLIPLADAKRKMLVTPSLPKSYCERTKGFLFSTASQIPNSGEAFRKFLRLNPEIKRVAIVNFGDIGWGGAYRTVWERVLKEEKRELVSQFDNLEFSADLLSPMGAVLKKKPDAVLIAHNAETSLKALRHYQYSGKILMVNQLLELLIDPKFDRSALAGIYLIDTVATPEFVKKFHARFSTDPYLEAYTGYETVRSVFRALSGPGEAVENMKQLSYEGVSGKMDFRQSCAGNQADWHLKIIRQSQIELIP